jgi:hypothetical protein
MVDTGTFVMSDQISRRPWSQGVRGRREEREGEGEGDKQKEREGDGEGGKGRGNEVKESDAEISV